MKEKLKIRFFRAIFKIFWLIPIKKVFFFSSYEGKQISCNPKYIFEKVYTLDFCSKYEFVWEKNNSILLKNYENIKYVKHNSFKYIFAIMTSEILITNSGINPIFPLRKKQLFINTWHGGGAYKKVGLDTSEKINGVGKEGLLRSSKQTSAFLSSSQLFTQIMSSALMIEQRKFLPIGMPRNDIFFQGKYIKKRAIEFKKEMRIGVQKKIVLYAPTFRGIINQTSSSIELFDEKKLINTLEEHFQGEWILLYRGHYSQKNNKLENAINVSDYEDIQDILCATDILITDYSSSIWDFSILSRPCFLYVPDLKEYRNERDFYTKIENWPGIICLNDEELESNIKKYDHNKFVNKIKEHYSELQSYEKGNATLKVIQYIYDFMCGDQE
ncbi:MAG: CDP-glycerol glycerophosphotransferase family protein [Fusobacterium necrophorum]|nr:CDP-glycerol glycerophosphotransferase family protein [Fusobacterium necrophorum]